MFRKLFWFTLGIILLCIAYLGIILPGIPWSTPAVGAAICFAKSSTRMTNWLYSHKLFGSFLIGWQEKQIFPTKAKYLMLVTMASSLVVLWFTTGNLMLLCYVLLGMTVSVIWSWRYPGSVEEYEKRIREGKKIAWLK
jgi:uncharacterized protein